MYETSKYNKQIYLLAWKLKFQIWLFYKSFFFCFHRIKTFLQVQRNSGKKWKGINPNFNDPMVHTERFTDLGKLNFPMVVRF